MKNQRVHDLLNSMKSTLLALGATLAIIQAAAADNPVIQTRHTADPAPMIANGKVYLYTGHDEDNANPIVMKEWRWSFDGSVASLAAGSSMEVHLDGIAGPLIATLAVPDTGGLDRRKVQTASISGARGVHDVFFVFRGSYGEKLFNFLSWKFRESPR